MSNTRYGALRTYLDALGGDEWTATFAEIEDLIGFPLPASARKFHAWWSNSTKGPSGTVAWKQAGFRASASLAEQRVTFHRGLEKPLSKKALRAARVAAKPPPPGQEQLLGRLRTLYERDGIDALNSKILDRREGGLYSALRKTGLSGMAEIVARLELTDEFEARRASGRVYRGRFVPNRSFEEIVEAVRAIGAEHASLPTMDWFRRNGHSRLVSEIFARGHSWERVREAIGDFGSSHFRTSRSGIRWRSHPEASFSDFLYARGIPHRRGERYDQGYAIASGKHHGHYDVHFTAPDGAEIAVEIWGDLPDKLSGGRYAETRAAKESWNATNPNFLGIQYVDCLSDGRLTEILQRFIGVIEPYCFDKPTDPYIETAHWTDSDELIETCRQLAAQQPDGILPNEQWLRKRGLYADREGPAYNTLAVRINQWLGGTRCARDLLGQSVHSTEEWSAERAIAAWREFEQEYGFTPTQIVGHKSEFPPEVIKRGQAIRGACSRYGVLNEARRGKFARKIVWTKDTLEVAWREFSAKWGVPPTKCVGSAGVKFPKEQSNEASRLYSAALRLGLLDHLKRR